MLVVQNVQINRNLCKMNYKLNSVFNSLVKNKNVIFSKFLDCQKSMKIKKKPFEKTTISRTAKKAVRQNCHSLKSIKNTKTNF